MIREVVEVKDISGSKISVQFKRQSMCGNCQGYQICNVDKSQTVILENNNLFLEKGDLIEVAIESRKTLLGIIFIFFIPTMLFLFSIWFLARLGPAISFFIALLVVILYYIVVKAILKNKTNYFNIKILGKV